MELIEAINKLWEYPSTEILVTYDLKDNKLYIDKHLDNLINFLKLEIDKHQMLIHPITIFLVLCHDVGSLTCDKLFRVKPLLNVKKITLNKYQDYFIEKGKVDIKLKVPEKITPDTIKNMKYDELKLSRPPQLRRILINYSKLLNVEFDVSKLKRKLKHLDTINTAYSYLDADETVLYDQKWYENTFIELLPFEIKKIISDYMDIFEYIRKDDIFAADHNELMAIMGNVAGNVMKNIKENEDMNIMDIINNINNNGNLDEINNLVKNTSPEGLFRYVDNEIGFGNLFESIKDKIGQ